MAKARIFIALPVEGMVRDNLADWVESSRAGFNLKWVEPLNYHLTLKFLGDTEEAMIGDIRRELLGVCRQQEGFTVCLSGIGGFPSLKKARVLWAGITEGAEQLTDLAGRIDRTLRILGFPAERKPFSPHLTLARTRGDKAVDFSALPPAGNFGCLRARSISIFRSRLTPSGPVYTVLADLPFANE